MKLKMYLLSIIGLLVYSNVHSSGSRAAREAVSLDQQLINAIKEGLKENVSLLLKEGANPNVQDNNRTTALMQAAYYADLEIVKILLQAGANPNAKDFYGNDALEYARSMNNLDIFKELLAVGADWSRYRNQPLTKQVKEILNIWDALKEKESESFVTQEPKPLTDAQEAVLTHEEKEISYKKFENDLESYWQDRLRMFYKIFVDNKDVKPLINFFCNEIYPRKGLMDLLFGAFKSKQAGVDLLSYLESKTMSREDKNKLHELAELEKHFNAQAAANKIQSEWRHYKHMQQYDTDEIKEQRALLAEMPRSAKLFD